MSTTTRTVALGLTAVALAVSASTALAPSAQAGSPEGRNRGEQLSCTAHLSGTPVTVRLHDDDFALSDLVVKVGRTRGYRDGGNLVRGRTVSASAPVAGDRASVTGTVRKVGKAVATHSSHSDDYGTYVTTGTRTALRTHLRVTYRGRTAPLTCATAYAFDKSTVKE